MLPRGKRWCWSTIRRYYQSWTGEKIEDYLVKDIRLLIRKIAQLICLMNSFILQLNQRRLDYMFRPVFLTMYLLLRDATDRISISIWNSSCKTSYHETNCCKTSWWIFRAEKIERALSGQLFRKWGLPISHGWTHPWFQNVQHILHPLINMAPNAGKTLLADAVSCMDHLVV